MDSKAPVPVDSLKKAYLSAAAGGLLIGVVGIFVTGCVGFSPFSSMEVEDFFHGAWVIPGWESEKIFESPVTRLLAVQAVLLRCAHICLDQGASYLLIPPLVLCLLVKMENASLRWSALLAAVRTVRCGMFVILASAIVGSACCCMLLGSGPLQEMVTTAVVGAIFVANSLLCSELFFFSMSFLLLLQLALCIPKLATFKDWLGRVHRRMPYLMLSVLSVSTPFVAAALDIELPRPDYSEDLGEFVGFFAAQFMVIISCIGIGCFFLWCKYTAWKLAKS